MAAIKECISCGAQNDVIFSNCMFCKTSLPTVDQNSITNEELVMKASEWIGKVSEGEIWIEDTSPKTGLHKLIGENKKLLSTGEMIGFAEKYLNLLAIRGTSNPTLSVTYQGLRDKLDKNSKKGSKKKIYGNALLAFLSLAVFAFLGYMASREVDAENKYQENLEKVEIQIDEALKDKNYDYALILIEKLVWDYELNLNKNQKKAEAYDKRRNELKETVLTLKKESKNGNN